MVMYLALFLITFLFTSTSHVTNIAAFKPHNCSSCHCQMSMTVESHIAILPQLLPLIPVTLDFPHKPSYLYNFYATLTADQSSNSFNLRPHTLSTTSTVSVLSLFLLAYVLTLRLTHESLLPGSATKTHTDWLSFQQASH